MVRSSRDGYLGHKWQPFDKKAVSFHLGAKLKSILKDVLFHRAQEQVPSGLFQTIPKQKLDCFSFFFSAFKECWIDHVNIILLSGPSSSDPHDIVIRPSAPMLVTPLSVLSCKQALRSRLHAHLPCSLLRRFPEAPCSVMANLPSHLPNIYSGSGIRHTCTRIILFNLRDQWKGSYCCPHFKNRGMQEQRGIQIQLHSQSWLIGLGL